MGGGESVAEAHRRSQRSRGLFDIRVDIWRTLVFLFLRFASFEFRVKERNKVVCSCRFLPPPFRDKWTGRHEVGSQGAAAAAEATRETLTLGFSERCRRSWSEKEINGGPKHDLWTIIIILPHNDEEMWKDVNPEASVNNPCGSGDMHLSISSTLPGNGEKSPNSRTKN